MFEISEEVLSNVYLIVDKLIVYNNIEGLSWMQVYKKLLKELKIESSDLLLSSVVKELTNRGYDIIDEPFKLERYR